MTYRLRRGDADHRVAFCFKTAEGAQAFAERCGGERLKQPAVRMS